MNYTIFDTPVIRNLTHWLARFTLKSMGWKIEGKAPELSKYVIIAAPHTSNWDYVYTLLLSFSLNLKVRIMAKKELFRWPFGYIFKWLGTIPIDRSKANNVVGQMIDAFEKNDKMILIVPPSGTRKKVMYWKTGFYHIANGAGVPIVLGYVDYGRKSGGIGPTINPTGNIKNDMKDIRAFYSDITGKYPEKALEAPVPVSTILA
ncbi:Acyltransferase family protein [Desulfonema limicola]|uniref:Acyltransferase family protein n=1 Tax=Desulfonema limicola TaxID=45656 RepID=A0A975B5I5_9BACT|nr:lysophospholipid acyltransferase family protein [Desulfonema limicola]QTA79134.1 Acyltransferase family protein [Desulfonema limicola]